MTNIFVNGRMAEDGSLVLPPGALEELGVKSGGSGPFILLENGTAWRE